MKATITIEMDNAAFEDTNGIDLARILKRLANQIDDYSLTSADNLTLRDSNGNRVGSFTVTE